MKTTSQIDASLMKFTWYATNITSNKIQVQLDFQNPLLISSEIGHPDILTVKLLPPFLKYATSLKNRQLVENPLRSVTQVIPC